MAKTGVNAQINWQQFEELCKIQCTQQEICAVLDLTDKTLVKHTRTYYGMEFSEVYKKFTQFGKASLRRIQLKLAQTSAGMAIFLGKNYLGQIDTPLIDQSTHQHFVIFRNPKAIKEENASDIKPRTEIKDAELPAR